MKTWMFIDRALGEQIGELISAEEAPLNLNENIAVREICLSAADTPIDAIKIAEFQRAYRNGLLGACDWTQTIDAPLTSAKVEAWAAYRTQLRNLPNAEEFPMSTVWPTPPQS